MSCIFVACERPVAVVLRIGQFTVGRCAVHDEWLRVLADDRYRTQPCPVVTELGIQAVMV